MKKEMLLMFALVLSFNQALLAQKPKATGTTQRNPDDNLNKRDAKAQKQGMWFYDVPSKFGDPSYYEFGMYSDDMKSGLWYKLSKEQQLISIENFKYNVLDGPAQYYENGKLVSIGTYRGIYTPYKYDTFLVVDPVTFQDSLVSIPAEKGYTKHGTWRYYDPETGMLLLEREYQVDILRREKRFDLPAPKQNETEQHPKMPHEGGKDRGWNLQKSRERNSLIK